MCTLPHNCTVCIVGCGTIGSILAHQLIVAHTENYITLRGIELMDDDIIEHKNLPYCYCMDESLVGKPKAYALGDIIHQYKSGVRIALSNMKFEYNTTDFRMDDVVAIDCRDTSDEHSCFSAKLNNDGVYGSLILNCGDNVKNENVRSEYKYFRSVLSAGLIVNEFMRFVISGVDISERQYLLFDYGSNTVHNIGDIR